MRRRGLSDQDRALWRKVTADAVPLRPDRPVARAEELPVTAKSSPAVPQTQPLNDAFRPPVARNPSVRPALKNSEPLTRFETVQRDPQQVGRPEPGIDRRTADRLRRGERAPDARIDLHGMSADRAHRALDGFIAQALGRNLRCVLVITGKGGRHSGEDAPFMRHDQGILRQSVPRWLQSGPHARRIVGLFSAHPRHGGAGALYVYLKKAR